MNTIIKLTTMITLVATTMNVAYSNPCYTNVKDGCNDNNQQVIHVKTNNTDFGFCTELTDDKRQKSTYCFSALSEEEQAIADARKASNKVTVSTPVKHFTYTVTSGPNQNGYRYGNDYGYYNYGYDYGYEYAHHNYNRGHRPYRPSHQGHRPPYQGHWSSSNDRRVTLPSRNPSESMSKPSRSSSSSSSSNRTGFSRSASR